MDMQDKEFDELFRSKLDAFEQEPSDNVWPEISAALASSKRRKRSTAWLSVAASVVVLATFGTIYIGKKNVVIIHPTGKSESAKLNAAIVPAGPVSPPSVAAVPKQTAAPLKASGFARVRSSSQPALIIAQKSDTAPKQPAPIGNNNTQLAANPAREQVIISNPVVPGNDVPLAVKSTADLQFSAKAGQLANAQKQQADAKDSSAVKRRHKIHNFAEVVDKIDKRKDKLIVFSSDDENDARITGVNLGMAKTKKGE
jgi:hypothetical protein